MPIMRQLTTIMSLEVTQFSDGALRIRKDNRRFFVKEGVTSLELEEALAKDSWIPTTEGEAFERQLEAFLGRGNSDGIGTLRTWSPELCTEKYRPSEWEDIIGQPQVVSSLRGALQAGSLSHLIFSGPPGVGKTSVARVLAKKSDAHSFTVNASSDRGIDVVREKIIPFMRTCSILNKRKILILEEAEALTSEAQAALKEPLERYAGNCIVIFLCNDINRFMLALKSRCLHLVFNRIDEHDLIAALRRILHAEKLKISNGAINRVIAQSKGDLRQAIIMLQNEIVGMKPQLHS